MMIERWVESMDDERRGSSTRSFGLGKGPLLNTSRRSETTDGIKIRRQGSPPSIHRQPISMRTQGTCRTGKLKADCHVPSEPLACLGRGVADDGPAH